MINSNQEVFIKNSIKGPLLPCYSGVKLLRPSRLHIAFVLKFKVDCILWKKGKFSSKI